MANTKAGDGGEEVDGERLRAESADDQDHKERRRFDELIERLGPVKFRRLADEAYDAHGKGDGESGPWCDAGPGRWRGHARIHPDSFPSICSCPIK